MKIKYCPICSKELLSIDNKYSLCVDTGCRVIIKNNLIKQLDIDEFSNIVEKIGATPENKSNNYMLLKTDLSGPMLLKTTNDGICNDKCMYCIIQAKSKEEAMKILKRKFKVVDITDDMIVNINIKEI